MLYPPSYFSFQGAILHWPAPKAALSFENIMQNSSTVRRVFPYQHTILILVMHLHILIIGRKQCISARDVLCSGSAGACPPRDSWSSCRSSDIRVYFKGRLNRVESNNHVSIRPSMLAGARLITDVLPSTRAGMQSDDLDGWKDDDTDDEGTSAGPASGGPTVRQSSSRGEGLRSRGKSIDCCLTTACSLCVLKILPAFLHQAALVVMWRQCFRAA